MMTKPGKKDESSTTLEKDVLARREARLATLQKYGLKDPDEHFIESLILTIKDTEGEGVVKKKEADTSKKVSFYRVILAGLLGGVALNLGMLLTFRWIGFGWNGDGVLLDPAVQSAKLIAVWTEIEPLPLAVSELPFFAAWLTLYGVVHAFIYRWLSPVWPIGIVSRGIRFSFLVFFFSYSFFEFFTPYAMFGEPTTLLALELFFWLIISLLEGLTIAAVLESKV